MYQTINNVRVWGTPIESAVSQAVTCSQHGNVVQTLLMAVIKPRYMLLQGRGRAKAIIV